MDFHEALEVLLSPSYVSLKSESSEEVCEDNPGSSKTEFTEGTSPFQLPPPVSKSSEIIGEQMKVKKRTRNPEKWKKTTRQRLRNCGEAYLSVTGKAMGKKEFKNIPCQCKKKCDTKFSVEERRCIFESFWKIGDYSKQNIYIRDCVQPCSVKRKRPRKGCGSEKNVSYLYSLGDGAKSETVCKKYFLDTLRLSHGRVYRCISKPDVHSVVDGRGKKRPSSKKDDSEVANIN